MSSRITELLFFVAWHQLTIFISGTRSRFFFTKYPLNCIENLWQADISRGRLFSSLAEEILIVFLRRVLNFVTQVYHLTVYSEKSETLRF